MFQLFPEVYVGLRRILNNITLAVFIIFTRLTLPNQMCCFQKNWNMEQNTLFINDINRLRCSNFKNQLEHLEHELEQKIS